MVHVPWIAPGRIITTSLISLTGMMVRIREIIPIFAVFQVSKLLLLPVTSVQLPIPFYCMTLVGLPYTSHKYT